MCSADSTRASDGVRGTGANPQSILRCPERLRLAFADNPRSRDQPNSSSDKPDKPSNYVPVGGSRDEGFAGRAGDISDTG